MSALFMFSFMKKEVDKSMMIGVILAALVIGGIISAITNDEELRGLAIKGVADAIKAFVIYLLVTVAVVTALVYVLIQALH